MKGRKEQRRGYILKFLYHFTIPLRTVTHLELCNRFKSSHPLSPLYRLRRENIPECCLPWNFFDGRLADQKAEREWADSGKPTGPWKAGLGERLPLSSEVCFALWMETQPHIWLNLEKNWRGRKSGVGSGAVHRKHGQQDPGSSLDSNSAIGTVWIEIETDRGFSNVQSHQRRKYRQDSMLKGCQVKLAFWISKPSTGDVDNMYPMMPLKCIHE